MKILKKEDFKNLHHLKDFLNVEVKKFDSVAWLPLLQEQYDLHKLPVWGEAVPQDQFSPGWSWDKKYVMRGTIHGFILNPYLSYFGPSNYVIFGDIDPRNKKWLKNTVEYKFLQPWNNKLIDYIVDFDTAVQCMDEALSREVHQELGACTEQEFVNHYADAHFRQFGEPFIVF